MVSSSVEARPLLPYLSHVLIAYGDIRYHHAAKFQILKCWDEWYSNPNSEIIVITDKPELFTNYPVKVERLRKHEDVRLQRETAITGDFSKKLIGLIQALELSRSNILILLDSDMYWIKAPQELARITSQSKVFMYRKEGHILKSKTASHRQFRSLTNKTSIPYLLTHESAMWGSALVCLTKDSNEIIENALELYMELVGHISAHTIEQFALGESLRLRGISIEPACNYVNHWSTGGRKAHMEPQIQNFFAQYGEDDFKQHLNQINKIKLRRPFLEILLRKHRKSSKNEN